MDITFVLPGIPGSATGGSKVIFEYSNRLSASGHNVQIVYLYNNKFGNYILNTIWKISLIIKAKYFEPKWFKLDNKIRKIAVFPNYHLKNDEGISVATAIETVDLVIKSTSIKKVYFIQDFENWNCTDEDVYQTYNLGMTNIVVANWLKNIVDAHSKTPAYLVSNCINTQVFNNKGVERIKHSIVFHYRSADYKGPEYAIEAIRILEEKYQDLKVDVISIENMPNNLPKSCTFHHKLNAEEIAEINNRTQVFMCTSVEEGFGLPGLEAMACGCAVVSSSYRGVLEYAIDGENSLLSPARDVDAMVNNIVRLFEDDELRNRIAENGVKTGKERSLEKSASTFERILKEINVVK